MRKPRAINDPSPTELRVPIEAGLCTLIFRTYNSTGKSPNTRPGIGFDCKAELIFDDNGKHAEGNFNMGRGVLARDQAAKLRDFLTEFLNECPPV